MIDYGRFQGLQRRLLEAFGDTASLLRERLATVDPLTREKTPGSIQTIIVVAYVGKERLTVENGVETVRATAVLDTKPLPGDVLKLGTKTYIVESVDVWAPIGEDISYKAAVRSGQ